MFYFKHNNDKQLEEYKRVKEAFKDKKPSYYGEYCRSFVRNNVDDLWVERIRRLHKDKSKVSLYRMVLLHGKKDARRVFDGWREKEAYTNTYECKKERYGWSKEQFDEFNKMRGPSKENYIKRYGEEEGLKKWKEWCKVESYAGVSLQYFQDKYGEVEGKKKYLEVNKTKRLVIDNFIRKYGEVEGRKKFEDLIKRGVQQSSKTADSLFDYIYENLDENDKKCTYYYKLNDEFGKYDSLYRCYYKYDFVLTNKKICIEFNGDYWHANPSLYKSDEYISLKGGKKQVWEIWNRDKRKKEVIESDGYKLYYIWESEYKEDEEGVKRRILDEIRKI